MLQEVPPFYDGGNFSSSPNFDWRVATYKNRRGSVFWQLAYVLPAFLVLVRLTKLSFPLDQQLASTRTSERASTLAISPPPPSLLAILRSQASRCVPPLLSLKNGTDHLSLITAPHLLQHLHKRFHLARLASLWEWMPVALAHGKRARTLLQLDEEGYRIGGDGGGAIRGNRESPAGSERESVLTEVGCSSLTFGTLDLMVEMLSRSRWEVWNWWRLEGDDGGRIEEEELCEARRRAGRWDTWNGHCGGGALVFSKPKQWNKTGASPNDVTRPSSPAERPPKISKLRSPAPDHSSPPPPHLTHATTMPRKKAPAAVSAAALAAEEDTLGIEAFELPKSIGTRRVSLPSPHPLDTTRTNADAVLIAWLQWRAWQRHR